MSDQDVDHPVDPADDAGVLALVARRVGTVVQTALDGGLHQPLGVVDQALHRVDAAVQVVLDGVEVAPIGLGDLGRDVALGDAVDIVGGHPNRCDVGIGQAVESLDHAPPAALETGRVGAHRKLALVGRIDQHAGLRRDLLQLALHRAEGVGEQAHLVFPANGDLPIAFALGELPCRIRPHA